MLAVGAGTVAIESIGRTQSSPAQFPVAVADRWAVGDFRLRRKAADYRWAPRAGSNAGRESADPAPTP